MLQPDGHRTAARLARWHAFGSAKMNSYGRNAVSEHIFRHVMTRWTKPLSLVPPTNDLLSNPRDASISRLSHRLQTVLAGFPHASALRSSMDLIGYFDGEIELPNCLYLVSKMGTKEDDPRFVPFSAGTQLRLLSGYSLSAPPSRLTISGNWLSMSGSGLPSRLSEKSSIPKRTTFLETRNVQATISRSTVVYKQGRPGISMPQA